MSKLTGVTRLLFNINKMMVSGITGAKITYQAGTIVEKRAKENITGKHGHDKHIITGNLRRSIKTGTPTQLAPGFFQVEIGTDVVYAKAVEVRDKTGGYLRPALKESKKDVMSFVKKKVRGDIL